MDNSVTPGLLHPLDLAYTVDALTTDRDNEKRKLVPVLITLRRRLIAQAIYKGST